MEELKRTKNLIKDHADLIILLVTLIGIFLWTRAESIADYRSLDTKFDNLTKEIHDWNMNFHGRLSALEAKEQKP